MNTKHKTLTALSALALMVGAQSNAAIIADVGANYLNSSTLPANYSYLMSNAVTGGTEVGLLPNTSIGNGGNTGWGQAGTSGGFNLAAILGNINGGAEFEIFNDGQLNGGVVGTDLLLHPTSGPTSEGAFVIVRRTITAADLTNGTDATISGSFRDLILSPSVTAFVYHNTTELWTAGGSSLNPGASFNINATLAENDTVDFILFNDGVYAGDETALRATIDVIPEPSSLALLSLGVLGLVGMRRRR